MVARWVFYRIWLQRSEDWCYERVAPTEEVSLASGLVVDSYKATKEDLENGRQDKIFNADRQHTCQPFGLVGGEVQSMQERNEQHTIFVQNEFF